jgi:hypothetical protein
MMDVEVDDQDPIQLVPGDGVGRRDRDVVEDAEAHRLGREGVMTRGADEAHGTTVGAT